MLEIVLIPIRTIDRTHKKRFIFFKLYFLLKMCVEIGIFIPES